MNIILSPHGDDEIIGCYSILQDIDIVYIFKDDYRATSLYRTQKVLHDESGLDIAYHVWESPGLAIRTDDIIYIPSSYDLHPLHKKVNRIGLSLPGKKMFYSTSMNVPWLEEEEFPDAKRQLLSKMYPSELETLDKNDKYWLFKSIKSFDCLIWSGVKFEREVFHCWPDAPREVDFLRNLHRHKFYFEVRVQQFQDDRDLEFFILSRKIQTWFDAQTWSTSTSCEMYALAIKTWLEIEFPDRQVRVSVYEDFENGATIE